MIVNPSLAEGMPRSILEGMLYGNIPIMSRINAHICIDKKEQYAKYFDPGNEKDFSQQMLDIVKHTKNKKYINGLVKYTKEIFSTDHVRNLYIDAYN